MRIIFSKEMYPKSALLKAAYNFTDKAYIHLDTDDKYFIVDIKFKSNDIQISEDDFVNEMLCQAIRYKVYIETKHIRELLVARSLSSTLIESTPDIEKLKEDDEEIYDLDDILKDWFDKNDT